MLFSDQSHNRAGWNPPLSKIGAIPERPLSVDPSASRFFRFSRERLKTAKSGAARAGAAQRESVGARSSGPRPAGVPINRAARGLAAIDRAGYRYKRAGIMLLALSPANCESPPGRAVRRGQQRAVADAEGNAGRDQRPHGAGDAAVRDGGLPPAVGHETGKPLAGLHHAVGGGAGGSLGLKNIVGGSNIAKLFQPEYKDAMRGSVMENIELSEMSVNCARNC